MKEFEEQIHNIKAKLVLARNVDLGCVVFGSSSHRYILHETVSEEEVTQFEVDHSISIPKCYRSFITQVGNGGISDYGSGAGPYLGIFPLGGGGNFFMRDFGKYMRSECKLFPGMSDEYWGELTSRLSSDEPISDDEYESEEGKMFGGILPLGMQGCSFFHGLILNGKYSGRIVNHDISMAKPYVVCDKNFLDWYERWLNEILSGHLMQKRTVLFGFEKGESKDG